MRVLVVEEQASAVEGLRNLLQSVDESIVVVGAQPEILEKGVWPNGNKPDVILVNRNAVRREKNQLLSKAGLKTTVTFSSGTDEYSFQAFRARTLEQLLQLPPAKTPRIRSRFLVKQGQRFLAIVTEKIAFFYSDERFIFFKTHDNQKFLVEYRMDQLERMLPAEQFFRVNRSTIISIHAIDHITAYPGNRLKIHPRPAADKEIIVSREKVSGFKTWLGE